MARDHRVGRLEMRVAGDIKMPERADPIFHGIAANNSVPMQFIHGEIKLFGGYQRWSQADIFYMGVCTKACPRRARQHRPWEPVAPETFPADRIDRPMRGNETSSGDP